MAADPERPEDLDGEVVARMLRRLGVAPDAIQRALAGGDPERAILDRVVMPSVAERTINARDLEALGGPPAVEVVAMMAAMGWPQLDAATPAFTTEEASAFVELEAFRDVWPLELRLQLLRLYGRLLARIAQTEVQLFRTHIEPRLSSSSKGPLEGLSTLEAAVARLLPLADVVIKSVHRRWLEHELTQAAVLRAETSVGDDRLPGAVEITVLFCDLKDFTAYTDVAGDAAAAEAVDRLTEVVVHERGDRFRLMKSIGDGYMLCYLTPKEAVTAGAGIVTAMDVADGPGVHASVHSGRAIVRGGDYFGSAVNLTARLLDTAGRHELVGTKPVVDATSGAFSWEPVGTRQMKGFNDPVEVFRLAR